MRSRHFVAAWSLVILVSLLIPSIGSAEDRAGGWTFGLRAGAAAPTQNINTQTSGSAEAKLEMNVGPVVNLHALYNLSPMIAAGLAVEWQRHSIDSVIVSGGTTEQKVGSLNTISILPTVEVRPGRYGNFAPYGTVGVGVNINSFSEDDSIAPTEISVPTNGALRVGVGTDFFLTDHLALNAELAWKYNYGLFEPKFGGTTAGMNMNASTVMILAGVRWR